MYLVLQRKFYHYDIKEFKINEIKLIPIKRDKNHTFEIIDNYGWWETTLPCFSDQSHSALEQFKNIIRTQVTTLWHTVDKNGDGRFEASDMHHIFDDYDANRKNHSWSGSLLPLFIASHCIYLLFFCKKRMVSCPYVCQLKGLKEENYPKNNVLTENGAATGHNFWNLPI